MSVFVILIYMWRVNSNAKNGSDLRDVYYGKLFCNSVTISIIQTRAYLDIALHFCVFVREVVQVLYEIQQLSRKNTSNYECLLARESYSTT